ncbi:MAG TPA: hypothetical protein GXX55_10300 [Firmicutes bacterium]|nr:hypothetical protein [Bacillota bacterium]
MTNRRIAGSILALCLLLLQPTVLGHHFYEEWWWTDGTWNYYYYENRGTTQVIRTVTQDPSRLSYELRNTSNHSDYEAQAIAGVNPSFALIIGKHFERDYPVQPGWGLSGSYGAQIPMYSNNWHGDHNEYGVPYPGEYGYIVLDRVAGDWSAWWDIHEFQL